MSNITATVGLNASSFTTEINQMTGAVKRFANQLQNQFVQMRGEDFNAYRASLLNLNDGQRQVIDALIARNAAEKQRLETERAAAAAEKQRQNSITSMLSSLQNEANAIGKTAAQQREFELRTLGATEAQIRQAQQMQGVIDAHQRLQSLSGSSLVAYAVGALGASNLVKMIDEWTEFQNRLKLVHHTQSEILTAQHGIQKIAVITGSRLSDTAQVYQRFAANQKALNLNQKELLDITQTVSKAIAIGGSSAESASAALTQFGQAMASGVLRGEELNSVMEQAPGLSQALARGLGVGIGQLRSMAENGELTSQRVVKALREVAASVDADFAKTNTTISQSFQIFRDKMLAFVGEASQSSGAATGLANTIVFLANHFDTLANVIGTVTVLAIGRWAILGAASLVQMGAALVALRTTALTTTATQAALTVAIQTQGTAAALASFQTNGLSGALVLLRTTALTTTAVLWKMILALPTAPFILALTGVRALGTGLAWLGGKLSLVAASVSPITALGASALSAGVAVNSLVNVLKGEDASNVFSRGFDGLLDIFGVLDSKTESLGSKLYDWLHPVEELNKKLGKTAETIQTISVDWKSIGEGIKEKGGFFQYEAADLKSKDLRKSISDLVLKYHEQAATMGKTKEDLDLLRLQIQKEAYLREKKIELEEQYRHKPPEESKKLIDEGLRKTAAALDREIKGVRDAMAQAKTAAEAKALADEKAKTAAENRRKVDETIAGLQLKIESLGKTTDEIERLKLSTQGASDKQLTQIEAMQGVIAQYEKQAKVMKTITDLEDDLERVGKSPTEVKLLDLKKAGASNEQLNYAQALLQAIEVKKQANEKIKLAGDKISGASEKLNQAANKLGHSSDDRYAQWEQKVQEYRANEKVREAKLALAEKTKAATQGGFTDTEWQLWSQKKYGHSWFERTAEYKAAVEASKAQAQIAAATAVALKETATNLSQASNVFTQANNKIPSSAQTSNAIKDNMPNLGRVVLDMRFPSGKALSGILFAEPDFVQKLKEETNKNVETFFLKVRDAVR